MQPNLNENQANIIRRRKNKIQQRNRKRRTEKEKIVLRWVTGTIRVIGWKRVRSGGGRLSSSDDDDDESLLKLWRRRETGTWGFCFGDPYR